MAGGFPLSFWKGSRQRRGKVVVASFWMMTFPDDPHSRFVTASEIFPQTATTRNVLLLFEKAVAEHGTTREVLTDHGTQFWAARAGDGVFDAFCNSRGIQHIGGGIGKPTTLGKIERWHRTWDLPEGALRALMHKGEHGKFATHPDFIKYYTRGRA